MSLLRKFLMLMLAPVIAGVVSSCSDDTTGLHQPENTPGISAGSKFKLSVKIVTARGASRAADHEDDYTEAGSDAENLIDLAGNDLRIVIFTKDGEYISTLDAPGHQWQSKNDGIYEWEGRFPSSIDEELLNRLDTEEFNVMALANWMSADEKAAYDFSKGDGSYQSLSEIWIDGVNHNYSYSPSGNTSWRPIAGGTAKSLIPMFGIAEAEPFEEVEDGEFHASVRIKMQRAMAKIEIIDNLETQGIHIEEAKLTSYNKSGRLITDVSKNPDWNETNYQVGRSSLPTDVSQASGLLFFPKDPTAGNTTWIAYVPEMKLEEAVVDSKGDFEGKRTHIEVKLSGNASGYQGGTYPVHFGKYNSQFKPTIPDESWNHLLRNHIYRFYIKHVKEGVLTELHLHVIPWVADDVEEWDFTDQIGVSKTLTWETGTYESIDENGNVYLLFDNDNEKFLTGKFTIMSPVNGRWYARLVPLEGSKTDAMTFIDGNGNVASPSTGTIVPICVEQSDLITSPATEAVIRIRPTEFGNDIESRYRLEFYVENMGKWYKVPMTNSSDYDYFTIVRRSNLIQP
ncbi:MAG: hypothetical protein J1E38_03155 [Paramuribaculum sp.]|nr:hypothetical protein [Paramuribaculum sp.]